MRSYQRACTSLGTAFFWMKSTVLVCALSPSSSAPAAASAAHAARRRRSVLTDDGGGCRTAAISLRSSACVRAVGRPLPLGGASLSFLLFSSAKHVGGPSCLLIDRHWHSAVRATHRHRCGTCVQLPRRWIGSVCRRPDPIQSN